MTQEEKDLLSVLENGKMIATSEINLRSKIDSIMRSLENLSAKKARIEFEIRRQKKTLTRKREELKRVSKSNQAKLSLTLENQNPVLFRFQAKERNLELQRLDSRLLQESNRLIETN